MLDVSHWDEYLADYMPDGPAQETIDPMSMFFEDRWVLLSRAYGKEFCMKLFYHTIDWHIRAIYTKQNGFELTKAGKTNEDM